MPKDYATMPQDCVCLQQKQISMLIFGCLCSQRAPSPPRDSARPSGGSRPLAKKIHPPDAKHVFSFIVLLRKQ